MLKLNKGAKLNYNFEKSGKFKKLCTINLKNKDDLNGNCIPELDAGYVPHKVEQNFRETNYFKPNIIPNRRAFSLVLPPPNVTGTLHLGHALTATVQDVLVRWKQMQGYETVWVPGLDHAGIATQVVVEKRLWKEKQLTRHDIGREKFHQEVLNWKNEKANIIGEQLKRLNISLNWEREVFTLDEKRSAAVTEAFIRLFEGGLIYRTDQLVNWCCMLRSAISDIEVDHINVNGATDVPVPGYEKPVRFGVLTHFAYKFQDSDEEIVVATTRPETMLGDVAVAVNPQDERYSRYVGRYLWHPFRNEPIPVISDYFVDSNFGTGAVKITPAHDHTDFEVGKRHNLPTVSVIDETGQLNEICGQFAGIRRFEARQIILEQLQRLKLIRHSQDHEMTIPICSRTGDIIEFLVRPQWFVKCQQMATRAIADVREGRLIIEPKHFEKTWFNWLENIRDWCISRQLWWGHRIPAYYCHVTSSPEKSVWIADANAEAALIKASKQLSTAPEKISIKQDEDVLDTWFSSALQPFTAFNWPQQNDDLLKFYPISLMETGHDILFFWVSRMVMLGSELTGQLPFNKILLHGIICDTQGRKMSKSLGNVVAPEDIIQGTSLQRLEVGSKTSYVSGILSEEELKRAIENQKKMFPQGIPECGADALRFTLMSHNIKNHFINFDVTECYTNKLFGNKLWQATKFTKLWFANVCQQQQELKPIDINNLPAMDKWILSRLASMVEEINKSLEVYDFHVATSALKKFLYYEFCDIYLESTKSGLRDLDKTASGHLWTLTMCLNIGLRCLAPFMPVLAQLLHQSLPLYPGLERQCNFPQSSKMNHWRDIQLEKEVDVIMEVIVAIRRLKKIFNLTAKYKPKVYIVSNIKYLPNYQNTIKDLSLFSEVHLCNKNEVPMEKTVKDTLVDKNTSIYMIVPDELRHTFEMDANKVLKKKEKLLKELEKMNKMISGSTYKINASPQSQQAHSKKIASIEEQIQRINYICSLVREK